MSSRVKFLLYDTDFETLLGYLPATGGQIYVEVNEPGSGNVSIPLDNPLASTITNGMMVQCWLDDVYIQNGSFLVDNIRKSEANSGEERMLEISGRGLLGLFDDAIVWDDGSGATTRTFTGTLGDILDDLLAEWLARGGLTITNDFTAAVTGSDSYTFDWGVGKTYLDILREFVDLGFNFEVEVTNPGGIIVFYAWEDNEFGGTYGSDLSNTVYLRVGADVTELENSSEGGEIKNAYLVKYQDAFTKVSDTTSITNYRRREALYKVEEAPNALAGATLGQAELTLNKNPSNPIKLAVNNNVSPLYNTDYYAGDTVSVDVKGTTTAHVIYGAQLDFSREGAFDITLELNTIRRSHGMKLQKQVTALKNFYSAAQDEDKQVVSYWAAIGGRTDTNNKVYALKISGGYLYAGGTFTQISNIAAACIARMNLETGVWEALGAGFVAGTPTANVRAIEVIGSDVYAAGMSAGVAGVYKWDGATWTNIVTTSGTPASDYYRALKKIGTDLYVGGYFTAINGVANTNNIAKWNGSAWSALATGLNGEVSSFEASGSTLYVAGGFDTTFGGTAYAYNRIAKWNGSAWSAVGSTTSSTTTVDYYTALCFVGTDLYFGAGFRALQEIGGVTVNGLAKWDGATWTDVGGGVSPLTAYGWDGVFSLATDGINLYVGGGFTDANGITVNNIAVWNGGLWHQLGTESGGSIGLNDIPFALAVNNEDLYLGGQFLSVGSGSKYYIAAYLTSLESVNNYLENSAYNSFDMAGAIHAATAKTAFVDADEIGFWDSVSSGLRKITWANTKATLKTYFDTLYATTANYNESKKRSWFL